MITKAIIEEVIDRYHAIVRVPIYDKAESSSTAVPFEELATALICTPPGMEPYYTYKDIVFVEFEENNKDKPVILGLLYRPEQTKATTNISVEMLSVSVASNLTGDININGISNDKINNLKTSTGDVQQQIDIINAKIDNM